MTNTDTTARTRLDPALRSLGIVIVVGRPVTGMTIAMASR
jgi:hypothetical protein